MTYKSIYRSNQTASGKLRSVRSLAHLLRWAEDCGLESTHRDLVWLLNDIMEHERRHGNLGTAFVAMEVQGWAAKDIIRVIEPDRKGQWTPWGVL